MTVAQLCQRAVQATDGDVFGALVVAHNVLRDNRDLPIVQGSMAPLRGDGGDERGARYHLSGAAIYAYAYHSEHGNVGSHQRVHIDHAAACH